MKYLFLGMAFLGLAGCVTVPPPLSHGQLDQIRSGKTAVFALDDVRQINYLEDKYFVLGVATVGSNSTYEGSWDSSRELSSIHAAEVSKLKLQATSIYDLLSDADIPGLVAQDAASYTLKAQKGKAANGGNKVLSTSLRDSLLAKGQNYLIWTSWSGYTLHIMTLGLAPQEELTTGLWVFDLQQNQLLWHGTARSFLKTSLNGQTGKDYLEKNNLSGLKMEVSKLITESYKPHGERSYTVQGIGEQLGLQEKAK